MKDSRYLNKSHSKASAVPDYIPEADTIPTDELEIITAFDSSPESVKTMFKKMTCFIETHVKLSATRAAALEEGTRNQSIGDGAQLWAEGRAYAALTGLIINLCYFQLFRRIILFIPGFPGYFPINFGAFPCFIPGYYYYYYYYDYH